MGRTAEDISTIIREKDLFTPLRHKTVLITGATGFIGSMLVKTLVAANDEYDLDIHILAHVRNMEKAGLVFGTLLSSIELVETYQCSFDYAIHTVSPTKSRFFIEHPVETIESSVGNTIEMLKSATSCQAAVVYLSSMEQYGVPVQKERSMTEDKIGEIDHLNIRSSYSESKRLCECLCSAYASEYGLDVRIARLAQTVGAGAPSDDNRMPMQFAHAAAEGKDIVLFTEGKSISNFVYLTDAITGLLTILEKGKAGEAYNVCNDQETRSVREIAELVANEVADKKIRVRFEIPEENMGFAPNVEMYLCSAKLRKLGWVPQVCMTEAYRRLAAYIQETIKD